MNHSSKTKLHIAVEKPPASQKEGSLLFTLLSFCFLCLNSICIGLSVNELLSLSLPSKTILLMCLLASVLGTLVFAKRKLVLYIFFLIAIGIVLYIFIKNSQVTEGGFIFLNYCIERINHYYQAQIPLFPADNGNTAALTVFYWLLTGCITLLLAFGIVYIQSPRLIITIQCFILIFGLMVGRLPSDLIMAMIPFSIFGLLGLKRFGHRKDRTSLRTSVVSSGAAALSVWGVAALSALFLIPVFAPRLLSLHEDLIKAEKNIERMIQSGEWYYNTLLSSSLFTPSPGTLSNQRPMQSNQPAFKVRVNDSAYSNIYLKGWIGWEYTGRGWTAPSEEQFYEASREWDIPEYIDAGTYVQTLGFRQLNHIILWYSKFYEHDTQIPSAENLKKMQEDVLNNMKAGNGGYGIRLSVTQYNDNKQYSYIPYNSIPLGDSLPQFFTPHGDTTIDPSGPAKNTYTGFPFDDAALGTTYSEMIFPYSQEIAYREYVYDNYLSVPEGHLENLKKICKDSGITDVSEACGYVKSYLRNAAAYSTNLKSLPLTSDFVEYFLEEQKKGFCTHFATAGTLMMRMLGIPARYVSGYIAKESDFKWVEPENPENYETSTDEYSGDYEAVITEKNAHAWVEIYIDGYGWYPLEMTPGYSYEDENEETNMPVPGQSSPAPADTPPSPSTAPKEASPSPKPQKASPLPSPGGSGKAPAQKGNVQTAIPQWVRISIQISLIILCTAAAFYIRRRVCLAVFKKYSSQEDNNKAVQYLSKRMYHMLRSMRYAKPHYDTDKEYAADISEKLSFLTKGDFRRFTDIAQKAFYSNRSISCEEAKFCRNLYHFTAIQLDIRHSGIQRFYWRYILCYF